MNEKLKKIREDKAKKEKAEEIIREKERRQRGQKSGEVDEAREKMMRNLEAKRAKKEKDDQAKERGKIYYIFFEFLFPFFSLILNYHYFNLFVTFKLIFFFSFSERLRAEIAADKAARMKNKG